MNICGEGLFMQLSKFVSIWTEIAAEIFKTSRGVAIITGTNVGYIYDAWTNVGWTNIT